MSSLRSILSICSQNFRKWQTDYRIWCIAVVLIIMTAVYVGDMHKICSYAETRLPVWIFPFLYSQFYTKLVFTLPVVLLFCNAPFNDSNQTFVYMRAGKTKWLSAQILYIITASAAYYLFLLFLTLIMTVFTGELSLDWGETLPMVSASGPAGITAKANTPFVEIGYIIIVFFEPLQAIWFTFLMSWLGAAVLGLVVFLCNFMTGVKSTGVIAASILVLLSAVIENDVSDWSGFIRFSPVSWITLDNIDVGGITKNPSFIYCLLVDLGLIIALTAAVLIFGRKKSPDVKG